MSNTLMFLRFVFMLSLLVSSAFAVRWLLRKVNAKSWRWPLLDRLAGYWPFTLMTTALLWGAGSLFGNSALKLTGATGTAFVLIASVILLLTLPVSYAMTRLIKTRKKMSRQPLDTKKRLLLKGTAAAAPLVILGSAAKGVANSFSDVRFPRVTIDIPGLHGHLDGIKILHMSDLHLGYYFNLDHLEKTLIAAENLQPDMLVVTGDIADDLSMMTDAMKLIGQYKPAISKFASVGNHEYFRGIGDAVKQIEKGPVPLLKNNALETEIRGTRITVGGADDPAYMRGNMVGFLDNSLQNVFKSSPLNNFRLLLSHRPQALDVAQKHHVNLVLSGHTHAGQLGLNGKSAFSYINPEAYLWGTYKKGNARLYTSAGMGHWFPFRLGVPLEAPLVHLRLA